MWDCTPHIHCLRCLALQDMLYVYPVLWYQLYTFLLKQRRKKLAPPPASDAAAEKKED